MNKIIKRIAINIGGGYVPGINNIIAGVTNAANELGWEVYGIHDGYDGLLFPEKYRTGGLIKIPSQISENLNGSPVIGNAFSSDPFNVRTINNDGIIEEEDQSDKLLESLKANKIDAVISVVEGRSLSILLKLNRKGLKSVCIPKSIENNIWATQLSFGFNSVLNYTTELLDRVKNAAISSRKIAVVEVPGANAGWLALQAGMASLADAVLIPEIPYDVNIVADNLNKKIRNGKPYGLVVVAEGAKPLAKEKISGDSKISDYNASLSPGAREGEGNFIIDKSGSASTNAAMELKRISELDTQQILLNQVVKGGTLTAVDRQLALGYGTGAVQAIENGESGIMVVFQPPELKFIPLAESINKIRTVPTDSMFIKITEKLGISLGKDVN